MCYNKRQVVTQLTSLIWKISNVFTQQKNQYIEVWQFSDLSSPKSCKNDVSYITFQSYNIHNSPANRVINQADFVLSTYSKKCRNSDNALFQCRSL